jgi:hypothetical protein
MFRKMIISLTAVIASGLLLSGCAPSAKLSLNFVPNKTVSYESTSKMIKDVEFDQPSLKKNKKDQTSTVITVKFDQTVTKVGPDGTAAADVTIKAIQCKMVNKNEVRYEFDSASEKAKTDPLNNLIGQSYRIAISPDGKVKVVDAAKARAVIVSNDGQKLAQKILSDESILERHQLPLPEAGNKIYTLDQFGKDNTAVITMSAKENMTAKPEGPKASGDNLGFLAKLFDNKDEYSGKLTVNLSSGTVDNYEETLVSNYVAQDKPKDAAADAAPDTLVMRLTYSLGLKKTN